MDASLGVFLFRKRGDKKLSKNIAKRGKYNTLTKKEKALQSQAFS